MHSLGLSTNGSESEALAPPAGAAAAAVANIGGGSSESNGVNNFSNGDALGSGGSSTQTTPTTAGAAGGSGSSNGVANNSSYTNGSARGGGGRAGGNEAEDGDEEDEEEEEDFEGRRPYLRNGKQPLRPPKKAPAAPYVIKSQTDRDIIRLIGQQLHIMGLGNTASQLIKESGCRLDHPTADRFRSLVMGGEWSRADGTLLELKPFLDSPKHLVMMKYLLLEQKYLESIEDERHADALKCLQSEIKPLNYKKESLPNICRYLFLNSIDELKQVANWEGKGPASRQKLMEKLQNFLPPEIMLPPRRLQTLLNQAIERQKDQCFFHNHNLECSWEDFSLLVDHSCSKDDLPSETTQILEEHRDEVWYCQFSNDGTRLATGSKDGTIIIWEVDPDTLNLSIKYTFGGHSFAIAFFAWSPDDHYLVALGPEEAGEFWIWDCTVSDTGLIKHKGNNQTDDSLTTCAWHPDSQRFVAAGTRGHFYQIDLEGNIVDNWEGVRVQCLAYKKDGRVVLAADTHYRIRGYNFEEVNDFTLIKEDHSIVSFVCDRTGRYALVNVESQGVHLWDLEDRVLVRKFQGLSQGYYTIHSCFGGVDQVFLASGSEDNKIYIWHKKREHPISVLKGHRRTVNCVSWNPRYTNMLASASDDTTVRIWTSKRKAADKEQHAQGQ
ncbi:PREDICTED: WD repeat-containing protein 26-like, partial [Rhagoletis zephyria]|uniref:WD repeat-containing protein 26-like n=1 Tax=Rhagoletis zephyria TaxID=28612 RepID=UPI00081148EF